jgi:hypothetical protein
VFVTGAVLGALGDRGHIAWHVLAYRGGGQPLVVWLHMGIAGVVLVANYRRWPLGTLEPRIPWTGAVVPALWFLGAYLATGPLARWPELLTVALLGTFAIRAVRLRGARAWTYVAMVFAAGPLVETWLSRAGGFAYAKPDIGVVPMWLPALYLHVALATRAIARVLPRTSARVAREDERLRERVDRDTYVLGLARADLLEDGVEPRPRMIDDAAERRDAPIQ